MSIWHTTQNGRDIVSMHADEWAEWMRKLELLEQERDRPRAKIARYDIVSVYEPGAGHFVSELRDDKHGEWVRYEDHAAALTAKGVPPA